MHDEPQEPVPPTVEQSKKGAKQQRRNPADAVIHLFNNERCFHNERGCFLVASVNDHFDLHKIDHGSSFQSYLNHRFYQKTGAMPGTDAINKAIAYLLMKAHHQGGFHPLFLRAAAQGEAFYYDLADDLGQAVRIRPNKVDIMKPKVPIFYRSQSMKAQVQPDFEGDIELLFHHIAVETEVEALLLSVYIVSCLIPKITHPVLIYAGEKGAAKTTSTKMIRSLVDPSQTDVMLMPKTVHELAIVLSKHYMPSFDNMDGLFPNQSDLLCIAATGGNFIKRKLFTDDEEHALHLHCCTVLNGINPGVSRSDLIDRSIIVELTRIQDDRRKEDRAIWENFERDKPRILGGAFRILSQAMAIYPDVQLQSLYRMADFTRWGYAIAEAAGYGGDEFLEAYRLNIDKLNAEAIESHPVAAAIVALMRSCQKWQGPVAQLLEKLETVALSEKINLKSRNWPKAAHVLSRRMKEVESNLARCGIIFGIRHAGQAKIATIERSDTK